MADDAPLGRPLDGDEIGLPVWAAQLPPSVLDGSASRVELLTLVNVLSAALVVNVKKLQSRIDALEQGNVKFVGVWQRALAYRRGSLATCDGSLWAAVRDTHVDERPGAGSTAWQLVL
jgi:hypothetical protein